MAEKLTTEILIVGGGMIGASMALAAEAAELSWVMLDRADLKAITAPQFDGRVSSISYGSYAMFEKLGVWQHLEAAEPILDIRVSDDEAPVFLHFDHRDVGDQPFGFMVENRHLRLALNKALEGVKLGRILAPSELASVDRQANGVTARLKDGTEIRARLCIGADGRGSAMRQAAGIKTIGWSYKQTAIVGVVELEYGHNNVAVEHFLPNGPFALLPMSENRAALIWSEREDLAPTMAALSEEDFNTELMARAGDHWGEIHQVGPRWTYPLSLQNSERYIDTRLALIGDAAHAMHPIAGQGLNLGLRDVAALAEILYDGVRLGQDPGDALLLENYQRWRRFDALTMLVMTDGLNRLFSTDMPLIKLARDMGLAAVERSPVLKQFFERHAAAMSGDLPKLIKGKGLDEAA